MSLLHLAAAAALAVVPVAAAPATDPTPPPAPTIVVQLCLSVTLDQVDAILDRLQDKDLVGPLAPLGPVTLPDADGLVVSPAAGLDDVRTVLNCGTPPTTAPTTAPTTPPTAVPTTDPAPTTGPTVTPTTEAPATSTTVDVPAAGAQVRTIPIGGVATGDGSTAP